MAAFLIRRLLHSVFVVLAITLVIFVLVRMTGDPVSIMFQAGEPTKEAITELRQNLGLDEPVHVQFGLYLKDMFTGNFGTSFRTGESVIDMMKEKMGATLLLAFGGMFVALLIAIPVGIISAVYRGSVADFFGRIFSLLGISFPNFWLGIMLIIIFAVKLGWFPASGYEGLEYLVLPSVALGLILSGILARLVRSSMLEVMNQQYINTARSKGIKEWLVIIKHGLRNALIPTVTFIGLQFGTLLGGTVIIEQVFSWPGIGRMLIDAISQRDFPVIQGSVIILSFLMIFVNLLVDISYGFIDPRIRQGGGKSE
ncbi:nickel ABC transporter permease [Brevibacillus formosus]|uniref:nickel ABC transporter permease n=1 Tax=Brevibacillus TaxID=55080 RepID=UPI000D0F9EBF|nr:MULTISPECIES: nickel ABC transporter permease [Brevibacillus]MBG9945930.1 ABC transporter permease [Brevibacillus formosus]MBW5466826.1 ABC transporter permease subunit [Brevibacillus formosus]MED1944194.1 ABC transporter permease [Brevibacillus formosus]MED1999434.1 ABC transporter permease [Brevibacillus formosus]MED2082429.1 ABC transporter permease [Brevibacillus formosus]